jgi:polysaccharide biosynthesis transport protein
MSVEHVETVPAAPVLNVPVRIPSLDQPGNERAASIWDLLRRLMRGRWLLTIGLSLCLGGGLGHLGWKFGKSVYVAQGEVLVAQTTDALGLDESVANRDAQNYGPFLDTQIQFLKTSRVLEKALEMPAWRDLGRHDSEQELKELSDNLQVTNKGELILVEVKDGEAAGAVGGVHAVLQAYQQLYSDQQAEQEKNQADFLESELARSRDRLAELDSQMREKLQADPQFAKYSPDDIDAAFGNKLAEVTAMEQRLEEVRQDLSSRGIVMDHSTDPVGTGPPATQQAIQPAAGSPAAAGGAQAVTPESIAMESSRMAALIDQRRELQERLRQLTQLYGGSYQAVKVTAADLQSLDDEIRAFAGQYTAWQSQSSATSGSWDNSVSRLQRLEQLLTTSTLEEETALDHLANLKSSIQGFRDEIALERADRDDLMKRIQTQDRLSRMEGRIRVMDDGTKPTSPISDTRPRLAGLGGVGGVVLGFGSVLLWGLMDRRVRGVEDAHQIMLGSRSVLGMLPDFGKGDPAAGMRLPHVEHCVHRIRTMMQVWYGAMKRPVFAITGPHSGSGKTTLAYALGLSFADARCRTLIVDLDFVGGGLTRRTKSVRHPRLGYVLQSRGIIKLDQLRAGLSEALTSQSRLGEALIKLGFLAKSQLGAALEEQNTRILGALDVIRGVPLSRCVVSTQHKRLKILPVGDATPRDARMISPVAVQQLIDAARASFDVILLDTGPLPGSLEAEAAAAAADGVVLTISRGDSRPVVERCVRHLETVSARLAGVVFNRATNRELEVAGNGSNAASRSSSAPMESEMPAEPNGSLKTNGVSEPIALPASDQANSQIVPIPEMDFEEFANTVSAAAASEDMEAFRRGNLGNASVAATDFDELADAVSAAAASQDEDSEQIPGRGQEIPNAT